MATCKQVQANISSYVDGELTPGQNKTIENHIKNCPSCDTKIHNSKEVGRVLNTVLGKGGDFSPEELKPSRSK